MPIPEPQSLTGLIALIVFLYVFRPALERGWNWVIDNQIAKGQRKLDITRADNIPGIDPNKCFRAIMAPNSGANVMTACYIDKIEGGFIHLKSIKTGGKTVLSGKKAIEYIWVSLPHPHNYDNYLTVSEMLQMPRGKMRWWLHENCGIEKSIFGRFTEADLIQETKPEIQAAD